MKVVVSLPEERIKRYGILPPEGFELSYINQPYTDEELIKVSKDADFLFLSLSPVSKNVIERLNKVKLIQSEGAGYDGIDLEAARNKGIYVCNAKGVNKAAVAEHTIGLILAALRRTVEANNEIKKGNFVSNYLDYEVKGMRELRYCHVGIIGLGNIGKEVVKKLKCFDCKISYFNHRRNQAVEEELGVNYLDLEELFKNCDVISLHVPLESSTMNMINKETIALMKHNVIIVNTARGEVIDQKDLAEALISGRIEVAALDTISPQPPDKDHPLLILPEYASNRLILTPHIAGITSEAFATMQKIAWRNMTRVLNGERPDNIVNGL